MRIARLTHHLLIWRQDEENVPQYFAHLIAGASE